MSALPLATWLAFAASLTALLHWILARSRDLGGVPISFVALSLLLGAHTPADAALFLVAGAALTAGWLRASAYRTARPAIAATALLAALAALTATWWKWEVQPDGLQAVSLVLPAMAVALSALAAAEQRPPPRPRPRRIPVEPG